MSIHRKLPLVVLSIAAVVLFGGAQAAWAASPAPVQGVGGVSAAPDRDIVAGVLRAADACAPRTTGEGGWPQISGCVRDLAPPPPSGTVQFDLWHTVLGCLSAGWSKDTGFDDEVVNGCLEDQGVL